VQGESPRYVSRAGLKLHHALAAFGVVVRGRTCADFGCNVGGFADCLLQHGAARVYAVDTGYGALAWTLRNDPRVVVMERTNALHAPPPPTPTAHSPSPASPAPGRESGENAVSLVVVDMGWTPQRLCIPAAMKWLASAGEAGRIITLIKPHYEVEPGEKHLLRAGVLDAETSAMIAQRVIDRMPGMGVRVCGMVTSPIVGGAGKGNAKGNTEYLALLAPA
jgi:23S rRNA (cytidine1920-2'-O)/16S rRNA (cytidine1409-2'-O)-methyltransferase